MSESKGKLFTIGEFSNFNKINKKTLQWYDEIDLFKPAIIASNGYRYYTYQQAPTLETILMLRELDVSIKDIKEFNSNPSLESFEKLIINKMDEIDNAILQLEKIKNALIQQKKNIDELKNSFSTKYEIIDKEEQKLVVFKIDKKMTFDEETETVLKEKNKHKNYRKYGILYGALLPIKSIYENDFNNYTHLFLQVPEQDIQSNYHIRKKGKYLCTYLKGSWNNLPKKYQEILEYAKKNNIEFEDYSYETGLSDTLSTSIDDLVTKIEIKIKDKQ